MPQVLVVMFGRQAFGPLSLVCLLVLVFVLFGFPDAPELSTPVFSFSAVSCWFAAQWSSAYILSQVSALAALPAGTFWVYQRTCCSPACSNSLLWLPCIAHRRPLRCWLSSLFLLLLGAICMPTVVRPGCCVYCRLMIVLVLQPSRNRS